MTRDGELLLLLLVILLMGCGLFATDAGHRHRHGHDASIGRRGRHRELADGRSASWDQDYPLRRFVDDRVRPFESRYPSARFHRDEDVYYHGPGNQRHVDAERRARYAGRSYRARYHGGRSARARSHGPGYESLDAGDRQRPRWTWTGGRGHRPPPARRERRPDAWNRRRFDEPEPGRRADEWRRGGYNLSEYRPAASRSERRRSDEWEDYDYHEDYDGEDADDVEDYDAWREAGLEDEEEYEDWRDAESEEEEEEEDGDEEEDAEEEDRSMEEEEDEEEDSDFYRNERSKKKKKKAPLRTYEDIIRMLTSDEPSTGRPTFKRDSRNAYASFKYEARNASRPFTPGPAKKLDGLPGKLLVPLLERSVASKSVEEETKKKRKKRRRIDSTRTKSLEQQDYDDYVNAPDNDKDEDLAKAGLDPEDSAMQADVTNNTEYAEDENENEGETAASSSSSVATTSTTTTTTTTTTTSTTAKPTVATQNYDYRDPRAYEGGTGPQYNGYQSKNEYPPMSAHSVHKWQSLGTRESVKETRSSMQQYNKNGKTAEIREALQHAIKVSREGSCQWPRPRVIPVRDVYPSPSTTYIPHCAILHRCSDDTGCCRSEALTCVPKHSHRVELSFYTTNVGGGSVVEKLSFYNHTECECRERSEYETGNEKASEQRVYRHHASSPQPQNMRRAQSRKACRCPSEFTPRITSEGECHCNCYETRQNCIKIRRGKGYFSLADRLCIQNEECAPPSCEFGEYMRRQGKCPRKKDKFDAIANYHTNLSHRYRS